MSYTFPVECIHITWPGLDEFYIMDNVRTLLLSFVSQWVVMRFPDFKGILTFGDISYILCLRL